MNLDEEDRPIDVEKEFDEVVDGIGFGLFQLRLLIITGLVWCIDAIETMLMSYFSVSVGCAWNISDSDLALLTAIIFVGAMCGSLIFGYISDRWGRRISIIISNVLLFVFALASAFATNFAMLLCFRALVGVMMGGTMSGVVLLMEYLPSNSRGKSVIVLLVFWGVGVIFESVLAYLVLPNLSWRYLFGLSTIPVFSIILIIPWIPESARFLLSKGRIEEAHKELKAIANLNGKEYDDTITIKWTESSVSIIEDFDMRRTTILLWLIWFSGAFCYFGAVVLTVELPKYNKQHNRCNISYNINNDMQIFDNFGVNNLNDYGNSSVNNCSLTKEQFVDVIFGSSGELFGTFLIAFTIDTLGRKLTLMSSFGLMAILFPIFYICMPLWAYNCLIFLFRGLISGGYQVVWLYTPEVYPTEIRSIGSGFCLFVSRFMLYRVGAMVSPYISLVVIQSNNGLILCLCIFGVFALLTAISSFLLPKETVGVGLFEKEVRIEEDNEETPIKYRVH